MKKEREGNKISFNNNRNSIINYSIRINCTGFHICNVTWMILLLSGEGKEERGIVYYVGGILHQLEGSIAKTANDTSRHSTPITIVKEGLGFNYYD